MVARFKCSVLQSFPVVPNSLQKSSLSCHPKALREGSMPKLGIKVHTSKHCLPIWFG